MLACWQTKPRDRPTFSELHKMLDDLLETSSPQKYLNLNLINYNSEFKTFSQDKYSRWDRIGPSRLPRELPSWKQWNCCEGVWSSHKIQRDYILGLPVWFYTESTLYVNKMKHCVSKLLNKSEWMLLDVVNLIIFPCLFKVF